MPGEMKNGEGKDGKITEDQQESMLREKLKGKKEEERLRNIVKAKNRSNSMEKQPDRRSSSPPQVNNRRSSSPPQRRRSNNGRQRRRRGGRRQRGHGQGRGPPGPPPPHYPPGPPPPPHHHHPYPPFGGPMYDPRGEDYYQRDPFGRRPRFNSRSRSRDRRYNSNSQPRSRSHNNPRDDGSYSYSRSRSRSRSLSSRSSSRSRSSSSSGSSGSSYTSSSASSASSKSEDRNYSKDQRTVFVSQLVMRATEKDLRKYFKSQNLKVKDIIMLRDRHTGKHKGSAYVELKHMQDVVNAVNNLSDKPPDFQRFPILVKASEAEKNYSGTTSNSATATQSVPTQVVTSSKKQAPPLTDSSGKLIQAQKMYVGNLEANLVTAQHLQALFSPFGDLQQVTLQPGKGYAFLQFHDPKEAALAIQTMAGQMLAGRPMKTGWATNQVAASTAVELVTSAEFPPDAAQRTQAAYLVLAQLTKNSAASAMAATLGTAATPAAPSRVPTVAEARASLAGATTAAASTALSGITMTATTTHGLPTDAKQIGNANNPTRNVLVHNMFDKDEETEEGWPEEIKLEFIEECSKYGKIITVIVAHNEPGGKIYATFEKIPDAQTCASSLAGRWFDKRQLRVEFIADSVVEETKQKYEKA